jgi:TonB family protein
VGFAAERCESLNYGVAQLFGRVAMVQTSCLDTAVLSNTTAEAVLSHEIAHLFGAFHPGPSGAGSVMRYGPAGAFDQQNARILRMMRTRDFTTGVRGVDEAMRKAWSAIYAEGHASDEPNPLAGAIANAGAALAAEGKMPEAEALIREAVGVDPSAARVHAGPFLKLGREEEALVELRDVLRVERRAPRAYVGVGMILARRNRVPEAISALRTAIAVDPTYGPAQLELAGVLDRVGQPAEAWAAAERAHDLGEDVPTALWQRLADKVPTAPPLPPTCAGAPGPAIDLDRPDAVSRAYVTKVRERIQAHHVYPRVAGEARQAGELQIELQLARSGRLDCLALRRSSGSEILDRYILTAVRLAQPFAPIPSYMPQPSLTLSGVFSYTLVAEPKAPPPPPR